MDMVRLLPAVFDLVDLTFSFRVQRQGNAAPKNGRFGENQVPCAFPSVSPFSPWIIAPSRGHWPTTSDSCVCPEGVLLSGAASQLLYGPESNQFNCHAVYEFLDLADF